MPSLKVALIVLAFLCCNYHVHSNPTILTKEYDFGNQRLIIGKNHINQAKWLYALCDITDDERSAECLLHLVTYTFDDEARVHRCPVSLATEFGRGRLDILGIEFMGEDKAIFTWEDLNYSRARHAEITIVAVEMQNCNEMRKKIAVNTRDDLISQVFIIPSANSYIAGYKNTRDCGDYLCKITGYYHTSATNPVRWFKSTELIVGIKAFNDGSNMYMVTTEEEGRYKNYFLRQRSLLEVSQYAAADALSWSVSNRIIALCDDNHCLHRNYQGTILRIIKLHVHPTKYAALYNLPYGDGHLAVICTRTSNNYRISQIESNGQEAFTFELEGLPCIHNSKYLTTQFYQKSSTEYCLSLFYSQYNHRDRYTFDNYCFIIN